MLKLVKLARGSYTLKYNDVQYINPTTKKNALAILREFESGCNCGCKDITLLNWCEDPYAAEVNEDHSLLVICDECHKNSAMDI